MLFGYPAPAQADNWFHDCLCSGVHEVHRLVDTNQVYPDWPGILPVAHRPTLEDRRRLGELFKAYHDGIRLLTPAKAL